MEQREIHAYKLDGTYAGMHVATDEQFNALAQKRGLVEGVKPTMAVSTDPRDHNLSPYQFNNFMDDNGFDVIGANIITAIATTDNRKANRIKNELRHRSTYRFERVLFFLNSPTVKALIPDDVDLSEATLAPLWLAAKDT